MKNAKVINLQRLLVTTAILGAFSFTHAYAVEAATAAKVAKVKGKATVAFVNLDQTKPLVEGMELPVGAMISTDADARVKLEFVDQSVMVVGGNTKFKVSEFTIAKGKRADSLVSLEVGLISQNVSSGPKDSWKVRTPSVVTAVRGTEFIVDARADTSVDVIIKSGNVWVNSLKRTRAIPTQLNQPNSSVTCNAQGSCGTEAQALPGANIKNIEERLEGV